MTTMTPNRAQADERPSLTRDQMLMARERRGERELLEMLLLEVIRMRQLMEYGLATPEEPCQHPEDRRTNLSAMGYTAWRCRECGHHYDSREAT